MPDHASTDRPRKPAQRLVRGLLLVLMCTPSVPVRAQDSLSLSCEVCHGTAAAPSRVPALHGRSGDEIETALRAYRSGERSGTAMPRLVHSLSDTEIRALAQRFGTSTR